MIQIFVCGKKLKIFVVLFQKYFLKKAKKSEKQQMIDKLLSGNQQLVDSVIEMRITIDSMKNSIEIMNKSVSQNIKVT